MKNGLMIYKANDIYKNIGDYIQSIAAAQFIKKADVYIEREHLHEYSGEKVKLIMNGWFTHFPENWPPSNDIDPLFVSFHIAPRKANALLTPENIKYLKEHAPIGCRDKETETLLKSKDIPAYFSGCLTLTLGKSYVNNDKNGKYYFVDPYFKMSKNFFSLLSVSLLLVFKFRIIRKLSVKMKKSTSLKNLIKTSFFHKTYARYFEKSFLLNAEYEPHAVLETELGNEDDKFKYAHNLLTKYSKASVVITSRIHCALPCLGMDTPVIFVTDVDNKISKGRFGGLLELFNNIIVADGYKLINIDKYLSKSGKIDKAVKVRNSTDYIPIKNRLIVQCEQFINQE